MEPSWAVVIIVGDEILGGHTQDTNSHWIAKRLRARGVRLQRIETIPDEVRAIEATLRRVLLYEPTYAFVVGGIGPTPDDRTYEGVGRALGVRLVVNPRHVDELRRRANAAGYGREAWADAARAEGMQRMIRLPEGSEPLSNPVGAALGCVATSGPTKVVVFPGVPRELYAMFEQSFEPRFLGHELRPDTVVELEVRGAEARLWETLLAVERSHSSVKVGSYPQDDRGRILLRLTGPAEEVARAREDLEKRLSALDGK